MENIDNYSSKINIDNLLNSIKVIPVNEVSDELRVALKFLRKFKLYESAKW